MKYVHTLCPLTYISLGGANALHDFALSTYQYIGDDIIIVGILHIVQDQISEEAVAAEDALGENTSIVHKRLQKMVSTGTVSNNKPVEKKPLSTVSTYKECTCVYPVYWIQDCI